MTINEVKSRQDPELLWEFTINNLPEILCRNIGHLEHYECLQANKEVVEKEFAESSNPFLIFKALSDNFYSAARVDREKAWDEFFRTWEYYIELYALQRMSVSTATRFQPTAQDTDRAIQRLASEVAKQFNASYRDPSKDEITAEDVIEHWGRTGHLAIARDAAALYGQSFVYPGYTLYGAKSIWEEFDPKISNDLGFWMFEHDIYEVLVSTGAIDSIVISRETKNSDFLYQLSDLMVLSFVRELGPYLIPKAEVEATGTETLQRMLAEYNRRIQLVFNLGIGLESNKNITFSVPEGGWRWPARVYFKDGTFTDVELTINENIPILDIPLDFLEGLKEAAKTIVTGTKSVRPDEITYVQIASLPSNLESGAPGGQITSWYEALDTASPKSAETYTLNILSQLQPIWSWAHQEAMDTSKASGGFTLSGVDKDAVKESLIGTLVTQNKAVLDSMRSPSTLGGQDPLYYAWLLLVGKNFLRSLSFGAEILAESSYRPPAAVLDASKILGVSPDIDRELLTRSVIHAYQTGIKTSEGNIQTMLSERELSTIQRAYETLMHQSFPIRRVVLVAGEQGEIDPYYSHIQTAIRSEPFILGGLAIASQFLPMLGQAAVGLGLSVYILYQMITTNKFLWDIFYNSKLYGETSGLIDSYFEQNKDRTYESYEAFRADFLRYAEDVGVLGKITAMGMADKSAVTYMQDASLSIPPLHPVLMTGQGTINLRTSSGAINDWAIDQIIAWINTNKQISVSRIAHQMYTKDVTSVKSRFDSTVRYVPEAADLKTPDFSLEQYQALVGAAWDEAVLEIREYLVGLASKPSDNPLCPIDLAQLNAWIMGTDSRGLCSPSIIVDGRIVSVAGPLSLEGLAIRVDRMLSEAKVSPKDPVEKRVEDPYLYLTETPWQAFVNLWTTPFKGPGEADKATAEAIKDFVIANTQRYVQLFISGVQADFMLPVADTSFDIFMVSQQGAADYYDPQTLTGRTIAAMGLTESELTSLAKIFPDIFPSDPKMSARPNPLALLSYKTVYLDRVNGKSFLDDFLERIGIKDGTIDNATLRSHDMSKILAQLYTELEAKLSPVRSIAQSFAEWRAKRTPVPGTNYYVGDLYNYNGQFGKIVGSDSNGIYVEFSSGQTIQVPIK